MQKSRKKQQSKSFEEAEDHLKERKSRKLMTIPSNSEERIILFAITCMEWEAVYLKPPIFEHISNKISLLRAIRAQCRDFESDYKASTKARIYLDLFPKGEQSEFETELARTRYIIGSILKRQKLHYEEALNELVRTETDQDQAKTLFRQRMELNFSYPENIPEMKHIYSRISLLNEPRKFRVTNSNHQGFEKLVMDAATFDALDRYEGFVYARTKKMSDKSIAEVQRTQDLIRNQRHKQPSTSTALAPKRLIDPSELETITVEDSGNEEEPSVTFPFSSNQGSVTLEYTYNPNQNSVLLSNLQRQFNEAYKTFLELKNKVTEENVMTDTMITEKEFLTEKLEKLESTVICLKNELKDEKKKNLELTTSVETQKQADNEELNKLKSKVSDLENELKDEKKKNLELTASVETQKQADNEELNKLKSKVADLENELKAEEAKNHTAQPTTSASRPAPLPLSSKPKQILDINYLTAEKHLKDGEYLAALGKLLSVPTESMSEENKKILEQKIEELTRKILKLQEILYTNSVADNLRLLGLKKYEHKMVDGLIMIIRKYKQTKNVKKLTDALNIANQVRDLCLKNIK